MLPFPQHSSARKIEWLAFVLLVGHAPVAMSSVVSLPAESTSPGSSLYLPVAFASQASGVSGIQFDVQYDSSAMSLAPVVNQAARNSGKTLSHVDLSPNSKRFLIFGLNRNLIPDGALIGLFANLNPAAPNALYRLTISNVVGTDNDGGLVPMTSLDGAVTIQGTIDQIVRLRPAGVMNGGSLLPGPVAPGEVVTLIGSGIGPASRQVPDPSPGTTILGGTSVLFDGVRALLLYAGLNQINAIVPYGVYGKGSTQLQITREARVIAGLALPVLATVPAIFTVDSSGLGPGAILNQDSTLNSPANPAARGSVVVIFATGAGQTDPPGMDGQVAEGLLPKPILPISVQIGGLNAEVLYAGAAPGLIAGVLQVNCRVPGDVARGHSVPVILTAGSAGSQRGGMLAIQ